MQCPKLIHQWSESLEINDGEFSPDGKRLVIAFASGHAKIYNLDDNSASGPFAQSDFIETATFSPNGRLVATASDDHTACIYDASTLAIVSKLIHPDRVKSARFSSDGLKLVTACRDGIARIWNLQTGTVEVSVSHEKRLHFAEFSHNGRFIATASEDCTGRIWDVKTGRLLATFPHPQWVTHISFSPDDSEVVTACSDHKARVWTINGQPRFPVLAHEDIVPNADFSPDGRWLLTACLDGTARLWRDDILQPVEINSILPSGERINHAGFSPDGRCVITTGVKGTVRIWDFSGGDLPPKAEFCKVSADGKRLALLKDGSIVVRDAATDKPWGVASSIMRSFTQTKLTSNGRYALASKTPQNSPPQTLRILDLLTGLPLGNDFQLDQRNCKFSLSDDGHYLAVVSDKLIRLIDTRSHQPLGPAMNASSPVHSAFFDPSGEHLMTWGGNVVQVWNVTNGQACFPPLIFSNSVSSVSLRGDGRQIVGSCWDDQLTPCYGQVWDLTTGLPIGPKLMQGDGVLSVCFSPDGSRIGTASEDFTAIIWNAISGAQLTPPMQHHDRVESIAFSPNGRWIVTSSADHTARLWDAETGDPLSPPLRDISGLQGAMFLSSATRVLTTTMDGASRVWQFEPDERPVDDISEHAKLLFGSTKSRFGEFASDQSTSLGAAWERLRRIYPSEFRTSETNRCRWHEFAADESEASGDWYAAAFHLKWLTANNPANSSIRARFASVSKNLQRKK